MTAKCAGCGKEIQRHPAALAPHYCSTGCYVKHWVILAKEKLK